MHAGACRICWSVVWVGKYRGAGNARSCPIQTVARAGLSAAAAIFGINKLLYGSCCSCGMLTTRPQRAHAPVFSSQPQAPRWVMRSNIFRASVTQRRDGCLLSSPTKPTPAARVECQ